VTERNEHKNEKYQDGDIYLNPCFGDLWVVGCRQRPLCRFAVIHISLSSFSPKAKARIRHYARKPEARYAGGFSFTHSHCKQRS
jgi:hypothetical protein